MKILVALTRTDLETLINFYRRREVEAQRKAEGLAAAPMGMPVLADLNLLIEAGRAKIGELSRSLDELTRRENRGATPRGVCSVCRREVALRRDGTCRGHGQVYCKGSGLMPWREDATN